jgi:hypothetical protein
MRTATAAPAPREELLARLAGLLRALADRKRKG